MVTRLTDYTKQFWILLSTDDMDTLGAHNGDEAIVIDRNERYVFDEENQTWRQIPMSGGGGGGSALPSVTTADNGKVLSVVDGAWAADDKKFVVTITQTSQNSGTMDKTPHELYEAFSANKHIVIAINTFPGFHLYPNEIGVSGDTAEFSCTFVYALNNVPALYQINTIPYTQQVEFSAYQLTPMGS